MKKITAICMRRLVVAALMTGRGKKAAVDSVKLGEYKGMSYTPVPVEVTDEQVEAEIQGLLGEHTVETEVGRAVEEGGIVSTDFVGMKDGVAFEGGTSGDYDSKLGSGSFINGLGDGLIDAMKGQELSSNLTLPDPYPNNEELAGQDIVFGVAVNTVRKSKPAKLNDALIKGNTESAAAGEYRKVIEENLLVAAWADIDDRKKSEIFWKVMDSSEVIVTDATVDTYYDEQLSNYESQVSQVETDLETVASYYDSDLDMFRSQLRVISEEAGKQNLMAKAIADAEGTAIAEEDKDTLTTEFGYANKDNMVEMVGDTTVNDYILAEKVVPLIADDAIEV